MYCTYNVTVRRVLATIIVVESNGYYTAYEFICSLRYPACRAHAPCCHLWPSLLYNIFAQYLINGTISNQKKKLLNTKECVLISSTTFVRNISHSKKK